MVNRVVVDQNFGVTSGAPNRVKLKVVFSEIAVDQRHRTSTVRADIYLINNSTTKPVAYRWEDGKISVRVNGVVKRTVHSAFDLKKGQSYLRRSFTWYGVPHRSGSTVVGIAGNWPRVPGDVVGRVEVENATLTLWTPPPPPPAAPPPQPIPPTAPVFGANAAVPTGVGTQTALSWTNYDNMSPTGAPRISPYTAMNLIISQANLPSHFAPFTLLSDLGHVAGGELLQSNYAVQTFWYTNQGRTLPSPPAILSNVPEARLLTVKPPANPPASAKAWGVGVARGDEMAANADEISLQLHNGSAEIPLSATWVSPVAGPNPAGAPLPKSSFANTLTWAQDSMIPINAVGGIWPTTINVATVGGFWYQFAITVRNNAGWAITRPVIYFATGAPPSTGGGTSGDLGDEDGMIPYAPQSNVGIVGRARNFLNASASVVPVVAELIDFAQPADVLPAGPSLSLVNYCGDPRAYWVTASTVGNDTASPYVAEVTEPGYSSRNAQWLPDQMNYAMTALGLPEVDLGHTLTFLGANNNTGAQVDHCVYVGGDPDTANAATTLLVPANVASVQVSTMAWINSANTTPGRTVTPFSGIRFAALDANGASVGAETVSLSPVPVNALHQLRASYELPANTARVTAALVANTAAGANWSGGYEAGESITTTGFMVLFDAPGPRVPYFDGGRPTYEGMVLHASADLERTVLADIPNTRDGQVPGVL